MIQNRLEVQSNLPEACYEEEPIHIPGFIKPYGVLLALEPSQLRILQVSNNTQVFLEIPTEELLNQDLEILLGSKQVNALKDCLANDARTINPLKISIQRSPKTLLFDGIIHCYNDVVILELEPTPSKHPATFFNFYHLVKAAISTLQQASTTAELCSLMAQEIYKLTGFDRVMIYQFDTDGAGVVVAEEKQATVKEAYLGLHFPATDIPDQARRLFGLNKVRVIPDIHYQPVAIVPPNHPITNQPLDLSLSVLRSVSPVHLEYLHNMGVAATMVVALQKRQQLWGLIACHHLSPKSVSYEVQTACEFLGQIMSLELLAKAENDDLDYKIQLKAAQSNLIDSIAIAQTLPAGLINAAEGLLALVGAQGCAVCLNGEVMMTGLTPGLAEITGLVDWLTTHVQDNLFATDSLITCYPPAEAFLETASGLLVLTLSKTQRNYLLWFRPEVLQTVSWAGNPLDSYQVDQQGEIRLGPRQSFQLWKETVQSKSLPWKTAEIEAAQEFRSALVGLVLRQADELAKINLELERSNTELDAFAYIASHDLKEPLRGIHNYANFLIEDYGSILNQDGMAKLQTLVRLSQRMENLINSLLDYSRLGRTELLRQPTDLNTVVQAAIATLNMSQPNQSVDFRLPRPLPIVMCDRSLINDLFTNLISNAVKYNDNPDKWVELGFLEPGVIDPGHPVGKETGATEHVTFYVRDNGIGIPEQHLDKIFGIFRRLHAQDDYGGGTGVGLTIIKKITERHGGTIWVTSRLGEGSTFYFTLPSEAKP
ncbi:MAG: GAF domain-containing protein [Aphanocapsa sp. GSE-SYN-MK-11-07L]|jgi:light-regulated signal transduction histidine kinase (bacteriophytochrome)|nr:GAF domain-containing protein [Aphanocapsa sp. GSE-SYN-MK-11-07L]